MQIEKKKKKMMQKWKQSKVEKGQSFNLNGNCETFQIQQQQKKCDVFVTLVNAPKQKLNF